MIEVFYSGKTEEVTSVHLVGLGVIFRLEGQATGGKFSIVEHPIEPGTLVPPRTHSRRMNIPMCSKVKLE